MAKKAATIRIDEELFDRVKEIGEIIELNTPGAEANFATISRYAIEDYLKRYEERCNLDTIHLSIPVDNLNKEQLKKVWENLKNIEDIIKNKEIDQATTDKESLFLKTSYMNIDKVLKYRLNKLESDKDE